MLVRCFDSNLIRFLQCIGHAFHYSHDPSCGVYVPLLQVAKPRHLFSELADEVLN